ncbi:glycosyltransferase [Paenibacillus sp. NPDC057934]|uniref:glycosyltransferase n=1 Tax=Paenibacillus sp. NPDC057934 TaxID=3346282 RepID=UPI0036D95862
MLVSYFDFIGKCILYGSDKDMKRILICTTILSTVKAFLIPHIQLLQGMGYTVDIAGNKDVSDLDAVVNNVYDLPFQRNPLSKLNIVAARDLKKIVESNNYDKIHFHTPIASALGRWVAKGTRKTGTKVMYTAHGFHFYKGSPVINWLTYYLAEKFLARYTDVLITINKEDYGRAKTFKAKNVKYVPGVGLNIDKFRSILSDRYEKRSELNVPDDAFLLLSVGELNENKNHGTVIKALAKLNNPNTYYVICGVGSNANYLENLAMELGIASKVKLLGFRTDIAEICNCSDIFLFPSRREGLGLAALEAMASGLPIVTSNVHGIVDYSINGVTGFNYDADDIDGFSWAINEFIVNKQLIVKMGDYNRKSLKVYELDYVINEMRHIYMNY